MKSMTDFVTPAEGEITLCEVDGRVHSMSCDYYDVNTFTSTVEKHPQVRIIREMLHAKSNDEARALFLPVHVSFTKQLIQVYWEQGFHEMLQTAAANKTHLLSTPARLFLKVLKGASRLKLIDSSVLGEENVNLINSVTQTRHWGISPIRCLCWHQYSTKIAVASSDDLVRIYSNETSLIPLLKCKRQKNVTCLAWRPMSNSELAVGCDSCIIIWHIDPASIVTRLSPNCATILYRVDHNSIMNVAWGPIGNILVSAATCDNQILVWDVEMNRTSSLKRPGGSGNNLVVWSPTGNKMFSSTTGLVFRVWDCNTWQAERWNIIAGRVQAACWSPCGSVLIFATNEEPLIYGLSFLQSDLIFASKSNNSPNQAMPLFDLTKIDMDNVTVGGLVQNMVIDPKGKHLAVLFQDTNRIAVFNILLQPKLQLTASCLIVGQPEEVPSVLGFQQNFGNGACLSIGWSGGRLQHFPIVYSDLADSSSRNVNKMSIFDPYKQLSNSNITLF